MIALALLIMTTVASFLVLTTTLREQTYAVQQETADRLMEEGMEAVRQIRNRDWNALTVGTHGLALTGNEWTFSGTQDVTSGIYTRVVTVTAVSGDSEQMDVNVTVRYNATSTRPVTLSLAERMSDWLGLETWGNWGIPIVVGSVDVGPQGKATGVFSIEDQIVLTAEGTSGNKPSFFTVDASTVTAPVIRSSTITGDSLNDVVETSDGLYAYTVGTTDDNELRVWNLANLSAPTQVATRDLNADGWRLYMVGTTLYAAAVNGLHIFDISNPASPVEQGSINLGVDARDVAVKDNIAYVATPNDNQEIMLVNVSNPSAPTKIGYVDVTGTADGLSVDVHGTRLYLGTYTNASGGEFFILDRSNATAPTVLKSVEIGADLNSLRAAGPFVFMATAVSNQEFKIYRVSDANNPTLEAGLNMAQVATDVSFKDNTLYIALRSNDAFQIIQPSP